MRLHSALAEAIPPQSRSSIVHGDYRIDNTILDSQDATKVVAVLDWELSTLGDPLSDAALMCVYRHPMFNMIHAASAWASPLMPDVDELANRYSLAAGQTLDNWDFYMALGYFKVAIIAAGIAFRARMGGGVADDTDAVDQAVAPLIAEGLSVLSGVEAGLQIPLGRAAQLNDARGPGGDRQQAAAHRGEQNPHAYGQIPLPREEVNSGGIRVLHDEHEQHDQDHEADDHCRPQCCGAGELHRRFGRNGYSPAVAVGSAGVPFGRSRHRIIGRSGGSDGSLVMAPSLPLRASNETTAALSMS